MDVPWTNARSVFLSDLHLGWRHSKPDAALEFLSQCRPEHLYLVGDTYEGLHHPFKRSDRYVVAFRRLIEWLLEIGTQITLVPGNHDYQLATPCLGIPLQTRSHAVHETLHGTRYLVVHGDVFDFLEDHSPVAFRQIGGWIYPRLVQLGDALERIGIAPRAEYRHWCTYWKLQSKQARKHIECFEEAMAELSRLHDCDGVVCGHIHRPANKRVHGCMYLNCGDWVEHRSCVVETFTGQMMLIEDLSLAMQAREAA